MKLPSVISKLQPLVDKCEAFYKEYPMRVQLTVTLTGTILAILMTNHPLLARNYFVALFTSLIRWLLYGVAFAHLYYITTRVFRIFNTYSFSKIVAITISCFLSTWILYMVILTPMNNANMDAPMKEDTIYITYRDDCPYCRAAKRTLKHSSYLYNTMHPNNKIEWVDLNTNSELAKEMKFHLERASMIFYQHDEHISQLPYSRATGEDAIPASGSPEEYYELFHSVKSND